jgi:hypothetical protein
MTMAGYSGGCQCGAVRYRAAGAIGYPHLCHCRMCQKASGNYALPAEPDGDDSDRALAIRSSNHQHPDHDTQTWPQEKSHD